MDRLEVSTDVHLPPEEVYEFLVDFPRYARYSTHLEAVEQHGDGTPGTEYELVFSWWILSYTARSKVTAVDPPERIDWRTVKDIDARGHWRIETLADEAGEETAEHEQSGETDTSRVYFVVEYDRSTARRDAITLPRFISFDTVLDRITARLKSEATTVVERVVADLEGEQREVDLRVNRTSA